MNKQFPVYLFLVFLCFNAFGSSEILKKDSIGINKVNGKWYLKYMVSPGETIYRISSKYKVPVTDLLETNPELENGLKTGQIIQIPYPKAEETAEVKYPEQDKIPATHPIVPEKKPEEHKPVSTVAEPKDTVINGITYHTVEPGESFFSLSKKYNTSVNDLLKLNQIELRSGSKIVVKSNGEPLPVKEKQSSTPQSNADASATQES